MLSYYLLKYEIKYFGGRILLCHHYNYASIYFYSLNLGKQGVFPVVGHNYTTDEM